MNYQHIAYLIGCYVTVADLEINAFELEALDGYINIDKSQELFRLRQQIFSDEEDKLPLSSLINDLRLSNPTQEQKEDIIRFLATVAFADGYMDVKEKNIIEKIGSSLNVDIADYMDEAQSKETEQADSQKLKWYENVRGFFDKAIYNLARNKSKNFLLENILGGPAFAQELEKVTKTASVDINRVSNILEDYNSKLSDEIELLSSFKANKSKEQTVLAVNEMIANTRKHIKDIIENSLQENIISLEKKKRNIRFFTIAFMGRTKAGKSTLHKVVTLQEHDDIGVGKQRTTRYNRSWYWDRLRIIDTPGIGAPGGDADTDIAKSIIDEADMICYVVTNDSIQETEFNFFETIKERNKPLYIIINCKDNLTQNVKFKRFLKDPLAWKNATGEKSLEGHFNRIRDMLDGKYNLNAVKIIPLHLLAAKMSLDAELSESDRKILHKGSNIDEFILSVKNEIFESGTLKKSMSIIDGSAYQMNRIHEQLSNDYDSLKKGLDNLKKTQKSFVQFVNTESEKLKTDLVDILDNAHKSLKNRASSFADDNYDNSSAGSAWENDSRARSINEQTNDRIKARLEDFTEKLDEKMKELISDMQFLSTISINSSYQISGQSVTNSRLAAGVFGSIITAAAPLVISQLWHPGGWLLAGATLLVGAVVSIFTSLFTSKAEKVLKAQNKMRENLWSEIDKSMNKSKSDIKNNVDGIKKNILSQIETTIGEYVIQTEKILRRIQKLTKIDLAMENTINSLIGFRILDYIGKSILNEKKIDEISDEELRETFPVEHNWKNHSLTYKYETYCSDTDRKKVEAATQMIITFK